MAEKKHTDEMVGEALREAGTLVLVFAPLYQLFEPYKTSWSILGLVLFCGVAFLLLGIEVERRRA